MSAPSSVAMTSLRGRAAQVLWRGGLAVLVTLLVNAGVFWSLAALHQLGIVGRKKVARSQVIATRIERPKRRQRPTRRQRDRRPQRRRRTTLPALELPSAVQIPGYGDSHADPGRVVLHDTKALKSSLLTEDRPLDEALVDTPPKALYTVSPLYPPSAQRQGLEGSVTLRLLVGADGRVERVVVLQAKPKGVFERAAAAAARQLRFSPARLADRVVRVWVRKRLSFKLR